MVHDVMPCHSHVCVCMCVHLCGLCERHPLTSTPPLPSFQRVVDTEAHYRLELEAMRKRHHKKFADATERIRTQHKDLAKRYVAVEKQLQKSSVSGNKSCPFCAFLVRVPCCSGACVCTYVHTYVCMYVCVYLCMYVCTYVCMYVCMHVFMYICCVTMFQELSFADTSCRERIRQTGYKTLNLYPL